MLQAFTITNNEANQRYDKFLRKFFKPYQLVTLKDIYAWMRKWYIKINWRKWKENYRVQLDDIITFDRIPEQEQKKFFSTKEEAIQHIDLERVKQWIVYEDENRLAFNKPAGLVIHWWTKNEHSTSLHDILQQYTLSQGVVATATFAPSFCYRLDKDTSGVIIAATTYPALQLLNQLIRERQVTKSYHAIVIGKTPDTWSIEVPLFKGFDKKLWRSKSFVNQERGQHATTHFKKVQDITDDKLGELSLLNIKIETGRMHQIRIHMAHEGYPVLWDIMYGSPVINRLAHKHLKINRQLLHASTYTFYDSIQKKEIAITAPLPPDIKKMCY